MSEQRGAIETPPSGLRPDTGASSAMPEHGGAAGTGKFLVASLYLLTLAAVLSHSALAVVLGILVAVSLPRLRHLRPPDLLGNPPMLFLGTYVAWCAASTLAFGLNPSRVIPYYYLLALAVGGTFFPVRRHIVPAFLAGLVACALLVAYCILDFDRAVDVHFLGQSLYHNRERLQGFSMHPIRAAATYSMLALIALALIFRGGLGRKRMALTAIAALVLGFGLVWTQTRGFYIAFSLVALAMTLMTKKRSVILAAGIGMCVPILYVLTNETYLARVLSIVDLKHGISKVHRLILWKSALTLALQDPATFLFGIGFGGWEVKAPAFFARALPDIPEMADYSFVHNLYLHILVETGLVGLLLYLGFVVSLLRRLSRISRSAPVGDGGRAYAYGAAMAFIAFHIGAFFDVLFHPAALGPLGVFAGLAFAFPENTSPSESTDLRGKRAAPVPLGNPVHLLREMFRGPGAFTRWRERSGRVPVPDGPSVVFYCHDVGELRTILPLMPRIREALAGRSAVVMLHRPEARALALRQPGLPFDRVLYAPYYQRSATMSSLLRCRAEAFVVVESDATPLYLEAARACGARVALIGFSFSHWRDAGMHGLERGEFQALLSKLDLVSFKHAEDSLRLFEGAVAPPHMALVANLRYALTDTDSQLADPALAAVLEKARETSFVLVAGSTYDEEERVLYEALGDLLKQGVVTLVVARRKVKQSSRALALARAKGVDAALRSRIAESPGLPQVMVLDTVGELPDVYGFAHAAFVGGTIRNKGGHNFFEPARHGIPLVVGPHCHANREFAARLLESGGACAVTGPAELRALVETWRDNEEERSSRGKAARRCLDEGLDSVEKTVQALKGVLAKDT